MKTRNEATINLVNAANKGEMTGVCAALDADADINSIPEGFIGTALYPAASKGNTALARLLIKRGADVNIATIERNDPDLKNITCLNVASDHGHTGVVELLLAHKADPNILRNDGASPLIMASQSGHLPVIKLLVKNGTDIQCTAKSTNNPLIIAAMSGHGDCVDFFVDELIERHRTNPAELLKFLQQNNCMQRCLRQAPNSASFRPLLKLINFLYTNNFSYDDLHPLLPNPIEFKHKDFIQTTYEYLKSLPVQSRYHALQHIGGPGYHVFTDLCHNQRNGYYDSEHFYTLYRETDIELSKLKAEKDKTELKKKLYAAAKTGDTEAAEICIANGAPVNEAVNGWWDLPIYVATVKGHAAMVDLLIRRGADKFHKRKSVLTDEETLAEAAAGRGHVGVLQILDAYEALPNTKLNLVHIALLNNKIEAAKYLFERGYYTPLKMPGYYDDYTILVRSVSHHPEFLNYMVDQICTWPAAKVNQFLLDANFEKCVFQAIANYHSAFMPLMRVIDHCYASGVEHNVIARFVPTASFFSFNKEYKQKLLDKAAELPLEERQQYLANILDPNHFYGKLARKAHGFRETDESHVNSTLGKAAAMKKEVDAKLAPKRQVQAPAPFSTEDFCELAARGYTKKMGDAIKAGANINAVNAEWYTPIMQAVAACQIGSVKFLLKHNPVLTYISQNDHSVFSCATQNYSNKFIALVIQHLIQNYSAETILRFISTGNHFKMAYHQSSKFIRDELMKVIIYLQTQGYSEDTLKSLLPADCKIPAAEPVPVAAPAPAPVAVAEPAAAATMYSTATMIMQTSVAVPIPLPVPDPIAAPQPIAAPKPKRCINPFLSAAELAFSSDDIPADLPAPMEPVKKNPFAQKAAEPARAPTKAKAAVNPDLLNKVGKFFASQMIATAQPETQNSSKTQTKMPVLQ